MRYRVLCLTAIAMVLGKVQVRPDLGRVLLDLLEPFLLGSELFLLETLQLCTHPFGGLGCRRARVTPAAAATSILFEPLELAGLRLKNRLVMAPMGSCQSDDGRVHRVVTGCRQGCCQPGW